MCTQASFYGDMGTGPLCLLHLPISGILLVEGSLQDFVSTVLLGSLGLGGSGDSPKLLLGEGWKPSNKVIKEDETSDMQALVCFQGLLLYFVPHSATYKFPLNKKKKTHIFFNPYSTYLLMSTLLCNKPKNNGILFLKLDSREHLICKQLHPTLRSSENRDLKHILSLTIGADAVV